MRKLILAFFFCFFLLQSFAQQQKGISTYLQAQYNKTLYDYTARNNPWSIGLGLQTFLLTKTKFRPTLDLTADIYLEDDKVFRSDPDGSFPQNGNRVDGVVNVFAGITYLPSKRVAVSFTAGPSFISGQTLLGIKPSFGFFFSESQTWTGRISYSNVFNRTKITGADFGSVSFAVGRRLFQFN